MKLRPIRTVTNKGKWLYAILRLFFAGLHLPVRRRWHRPRKDFAEDPLTMRMKDVLYLGYKYYHKPHTSATADSSIETYFRSQDLRFDTSDFVPTHTCTLHAGGDLMPYRLVNEQSTRQLWDEVGDFFFSGDLVFANLETPLVTEKPAQAVPEIMLSDMYFNSTENMFRIFSGNGKYRGFDVLSIANNHSLDMGADGLHKTMQFLQQQNIAWCGAAASAAGVNNFPIPERNGVRVAFLAYTYSLNKMQVPHDTPWLVNHLPLNVPGCDLSRIIEQCRLARQRGADFIVVSLHAGNAYQAFPSQHTINLFHRIFETCGPDIILGGHPHNAQPMEAYRFTDPHTGESRQGFAIYSLADFVAWDIFSWCHMPVLLRLQLSKGHVNGEPETRISRVGVMPVYNCYDAKQKQLKFIPLQKALQQKGQFAPRNRKELDELEYFCYNYFLPVHHTGLVL